MKVNDMRCILALVACVTLSPAGDSMAQMSISGEGVIFPDGSVQTTAPGQEFIRAAGSNFVPRDSNVNFHYYGGGCLVRDTGAGDSWFTYDLQLPDGAQIDYLRVYYRDSSSTYDIDSELWAFNGAGGTNLLAEADSSDIPGYSSTGSGYFTHIVDNTNESLVVIARIPEGAGTELALCGIRIRYQSPGTFTSGAREADSSPPDPFALDNGEQGMVLGESKPESDNDLPEE